MSRRGKNLGFPDGMAEDRASPSGGRVPNKPELPAPWEERQRLAQLLHDTICQELTGIGLRASTMASKQRVSCPEAAQQFQEIVGLLRHAGATLSEIVRDLRGDAVNPEKR